MGQQIIICILCKNQTLAFRVDRKFCDLCYKKRHNQKQREYGKGEKARARYARYRAKPEYKLYSRNRYHLMDENKRKARYYVSNAVRDGRLIRAKNCSKCRIKDWGIKRSMIEANHYLGYEPGNWFKIEWICTNCHKLADGFIRKEDI